MRAWADAQSAGLLLRMRGPACRAIVAVAMVSAAAAVAAAGHSGSEYQAPDFRTMTLDGNSQGMPFQLNQLRGQVVYLDFWASWCIPCRLSFPALDQLHKKYRGRGFEVVAVNKDVVAADSGRFLARIPVGFTLVTDPDDRIVRAYQVKSMPSGYLLDRKGRVRHVHEGFRSNSAEQIEAQIIELLKEPS